MDPSQDAGREPEPQLPATDSFPTDGVPVPPPEEAGALGGAANGAEAPAGSGAADADADGDVDADAALDEDAQPRDRRRRRRGRGRGRGRPQAPVAPPLLGRDPNAVNPYAQAGDDRPLWQQFGVPPSYWSRDSGRPPRRGGPAGGNTFGQGGNTFLPSGNTFGSSGPGGQGGRGGPSRGPAGGQAGGQASGRRRGGRTLECRLCGVKIERKAAHGSGRVPCPFCGKWMVER